MSNTQLIQIFNANVAAWLSDQHSGEFELDGVDFELVYDGAYRVLCEGVVVAHTDSARDFREVGTWLLNNKDLA